MAARSAWRKVKKGLLLLFMLLLVFVGYVEVVNRNTHQMTYRQKVLKAVYPLWMWWTRVTGKNTKKMDNPASKQPIVSFYDLTATANSGQEIRFSDFKGKKVMLVNTASNCGYTNQYEDLQKLYEANADQLVVVGFPANDFKEQEKGSDEEIAQFCKLNYGVTFPLARKSVVVKSPEQHPVFQWLTDASKNGWCDQQPSWNFTKYLVNEKGVLVHYFDPSVSPASAAVSDAVKE